MRTGETVREGQGSSYQLGQLLGRGLWGRAFLVRRESDDTLHVLKCPLSAADFRAEAPGGVLAVSREALLELARIYEQAPVPFLPRLEDRLTLPDGQPAIVIPRYADTLERRMHEGLPVGTVLDVLLTVATQLRQLAAAGVGGVPFHGGIRPSNILFNERGEIILSDMATPAVRRHLPRLAAAAGGDPWLPPEIVDAVGEPAWSASADTWALSMILWRSITASEGPPAWPRGGLDKAAQVALKDRLIDRMKLEDSNPRFHARLAERVAVLLSRALSRETSPSPPYRFPRADELHGRLEEVSALIRPQVNAVSKVLQDRTAAKPWFTTDEDVQFTCTVSCTVGVEGHEEIGVGIAVFELDRDIRLKELDLGYSVDRHPSGRYRFSFRIGGMGPGRYRARIAFAIRDSGQPPATTESEFNIRAAPGWVPRAEPAAPPAPLALRPEPDTVTERHASPELPDAPVAGPPGAAFAVPAVSLPSISLPSISLPSISLPGAPAFATPVRTAQPSETPISARIIAPPPPGPRPATTPATTPATPPATTPAPRPVAPPARSTRPVEEAPSRFEERSITAVPLRGALPATGVALPRPMPPMARVPEAPTPVAPEMDDDEIVDLPAPPVLPMPARPSPAAISQAAISQAAISQAAVPPASSAPGPQRVPVAPRVELPPEPVMRPRDWSHEPLPNAQRSRDGGLRDLESEPQDPPSGDYGDDDPSGPSWISRQVELLRNDPYIAVMAGLAVIIAILILVFLSLRN